MNRRELLERASALAIPGVLGALAASPAARSAAESAPGRTPVLVFTKHLQFLSDYAEMSAFAAEVGFDGLDLTVRDGGHVDPKRVEADLPRAFEAARAAGLPVPMITTRVADAANETDRAVVRTAAALGIPFYRIGGFHYDPRRPVAEQVEEMRSRFLGLAELNAELGPRAVYQNHSGTRDFGAPLWDLWHAMREIDPARVGVNFDVGHATLEGGLSWETDYRLLADRIGVVTVKDFLWRREEKPGGRWRPEWTPLGEGMIRLDAFLPMLKRDGFAGPITLHFEHEFDEKDPDAVRAVMKRDLGILREALSAAGMA